MRIPLIAITLAVSAPLPAANTGPPSTPLSMKGGTRPSPATFTVRRVATLNSPTSIAFLPDGRMLITEKPGAVRLVTQRGQVSPPLAGVPRVTYDDQAGLLDVALSPEFAHDRFVYLSYSEPGPGGSSLALARATLAPDARSLLKLQVIWRQSPKGSGGQFGGAIAFSPDGQYLFLASGERQRKTPAQDRDQALGKIERLTTSGGLPSGNPDYGHGVVRSATWSTGHRNPYGLVFDGAGRLWDVEFGPLGGDELNLVERGRNYGWPIVSNGDNYDGSPIPDHPTRPEFVAPRLWWNPVISPGGMIYYTGDRFARWKGGMLIAGLSSQALVRVAIDAAGHAREAERFDLGKRLRGIAQGPDGSIWLAEDGEGGALMQLVPKG